MRKLFFVTVLILIVTLTGCITAQSVKAPRIALGKVRLLDSTGLTQRLEVELLVANPNDFDIPLTGLQFVMQMNGLDFANGLSNARVTLPRLGEAVVPVTVTVSILAVLQQVRAVSESTGLEYKITGEVFIDHALVGKVPFEKSGKLEMGGKPGETGFRPI